MSETENKDDVEVVREAPQGAEAGSEIVLARHVLPTHLPIVPVDQRPFFPKMMLPLVVDEPNIMNLLAEAAEAKSKCIGILLRKALPEAEAGQRAEAVAKPEDKAAAAKNSAAPELYGVGVAAEILHMGRLGADGPMHVMLRCLERFRVIRLDVRDGRVSAEVEYLPETEMTMNQELKAYAISVVKSLKELVQLDPLHKEELKLFMAHSSLDDPGRLADFSAALTTSTAPELQEILETVSIRMRLERVLALLTREIEVSRLQVRISKQIEEKLTKQQREFFLREQLKAIKKELGLTKDDKDAEREQFAERLKTLSLTPEARERVQEELDKLKFLEPVSPEFNVTRNYLDWLTLLPWGVFTDDVRDIRRAERVLNQDHYGLEDVKERILEFLSVGLLQGSISGSIICFVGPPGVGKTSLGQSIARSVGRHFYRFSLGGIHDEAEIKGHRRTYIGAMPGKFIQAMKVCRSANPVIMLDEIDKIGANYRGDPAAALLEVLDPEQNSQFLDHYLDVRFDLSNVFFICTANQVDTIPRPLLDRMEVIKLPGYIMAEKMQIAKKYLVPKQLESHGIKKGQVEITDGALREIIEGYAREAGVRSLEKHVRRIMRKAARRFVAGGPRRMRVDAPDVARLLGKREYSEDQTYDKPRIGVVTGLAWTSLGGDIIHIEAQGVATGQPGFKQTGQLGSVMVESTDIAYTHVRSLLQDNQAAREYFKTHFVHLHVPAGATPKDGPSAGVTMATALYSLALRKPVRRRLAMTGELSLTGLVMPIGGLKEKVIAARRSKIAFLILPEENRKDFDELPAHMKKGLRPNFVKHFSEVVKLCFGRAAAATGD